MEDLLIGFYVFLKIGEHRDFDRVIKCLLFAALFIAVFGVIQFIFSINIFSYLDIVKSSRQLFSSASNQRLGMRRIEGPFGHSLALCNFLLMIIPLGIYKWRISKSIKVKTGYLALIILLFVNLILSLSRGPMLSFAFGLLFYFALTDKRTKQIIFMLLSLLIGLLAVAKFVGAMPGFIRNYLVSILDSVLMRNTSIAEFGSNSNASTYRLYLFDLAKKLVTDKFFWIGRGTSFFRLNEVYDWVPGMSTTSEIRVTSVDNYYILKYIEMGFSGLFSTLLFIFSLIYASISNFKKSINKGFAASCIFIFLSYFISLFTVDELGTLKFLWIVLGIFAAKLSLSGKVTLKE
jgi:hypothetical protein